MTDTIDIFNDIIKILDSIVVMEGTIKQAAVDGKKFIEDFKSGNIEQTQAACDALSKSLGALETVFKDHTLGPAMDLYQQIKQLLHIHIGQGEQRLLEFEKSINLGAAKKLLAHQEEKIKEKEPHAI